MSVSPRNFSGSLVRHSHAWRTPRPGDHECRNRLWEGVLLPTAKTRRVEPKRPRNMGEFTVRCLEALADQDLGHCVSIGGALALFHYVDYRNTHHVDAWWNPSLGSDERNGVIAAIHNVLSSYGEVRQRSWGDVLSIELLQGRKKVFSFQLARRSAQLEPTQPAPWVAVQLDSLTDLVASKMAALVERGAPRNFRDLYTLCQVGLVDPGQCWEFWSRRQVAAGAESDFRRAVLAVETHLTRIEDYRPLSSIASPADRQQAESVRTWFREVFLNGPP